MRSALPGALGADATASPFLPIVDPAAQLSLKFQRLCPFVLDLVSAGIRRICDIVLTHLSNPITPADGGGSHAKVG